MAGGGQGGGWRVAEVILLIYDFSTFSNCEDYRLYAQRRRGRGEGMGSEGGIRRGVGEVVTLF